MMGKIKVTFWSILIVNWILVGMGVAAFVLAVLKALGGEIDMAALFGALGTIDVISTLKFAMDRAQRSLGDQVQVVTANIGLMEQIKSINKIPKKTNTLQEMQDINKEIRKSTFDTMKLIQNFTKFAEPLKEKPWIRELPIRFGQLQKDGVIIEDSFTIKENEIFELSCSITNISDKPLEIRCAVIAVRPPFGTPDGGPFRFDFHIDNNVRLLMPNEPFLIKGKKNMITNGITGKPEKIKDEWYDTEDWYAFIACETEDGCWHNDHNKRWFAVEKSSQS
jgi:hypothetical protein